MIGVDEVGRGAWAGNLVVAAVRWQSSLDSRKLCDSKCLTAVRRQALARQLLAAGCQAAYAQIAPASIDKHGLTWAQTEAFKRAVAQLNPSAGEEIVVDGKINYLKDSYPNSRAVVKADRRVAAVMAASVLAKVRRDRQMVILDGKHPRYGFARHKGYGTALHLRNLRRFRPLARIHRFSYKPVAQTEKCA